MDGRSSSEITMDMHNGISERYVRNLSNMAPDIFPEIHEKNIEKLKNVVNSYVLQIDGTADSDFSMIVAVKDSISDFILIVNRYRSE